MLCCVGVMPLVILLCSTGWTLGASTPLISLGLDLTSMVLSALYRVSLVRA